MNIQIKENSFTALVAAKLHSTNKMAITINKKILLHNVSRKDFLNNETWLKHELEHVEQYRRYGVLKFLWLYVRYSIQYGYFNNPLEVQARKKENESYCKECYSFE
jgi:hypothetical protein